MKAISAKTAQVIVNEIGTEIGEHINFMDAQGQIIASTDAARIGTKHEGAQKVIREKLDYLYVSKDMETPTTKMGVNLPIVIENEIIGVIGITGEVKRVMGYGQIVRHMTQIMIEDGLLKDERRYDRRVRYRFLEEWIADTSASHNMAFVKRGLELGIDIRKPRRAIAIHILNYQILSGTLEGQEKLESIEASVRHMVPSNSDNLYLRVPPKQFILLTDNSDYTIKQFAQQIQKKIQTKYEEQLFFGVDGSPKAEYCAFKSCNQAEKAADSAIAHNRSIVFYDELNIELFMDEISPNTMEEYIHKLFEGKNNEEIERQMQLIETYFNADGSITEAADILYIHKNTLQYQLKKLFELTGKDIRRPSDACIYYMALMFYKKLYKKPSASRI